MRLLALLLVPALAAAQRVPGIALKPADAKLEEEFTRIYWLRELADGRVLISDNSPENRLVVADLRSGMVAAIGRTGSGPGEFRSAEQLFALGRDSTLLVDGGNRRWLLLDGSRIVATLPPETPAIRAAPSILFGADRTGHVLGQRIMRSVRVSSGFRRDSVAIVLADRNSAHADTILRLKGIETDVRVQPDPSGSGPRVTVRMPVYTVGEQVLLFLDGWIAVSRLDPYRVDWRSPDGRVTRGPSLPFTPIKLDDREKEAYRERTQKLSGAPSRMPPGFPWLAEIPPFRQNALLAAPDGGLLILRTQNSAAPDTRYDVVDRSGALVGQITLANNERIVGFGARSVYVAWKDDDDLERLKRHPWP